MRTGRAVLYPVYKGTFERQVDKLNHPNVFHETMVEFAKDASRSVDYLKSRPDIQMKKLAYYGISLGATLGPVLMALDDRLKAGVLVSGGLYNDPVPPEIDILNFVPRLHTPPSSLQQPLFRPLGTPEADKRSSSLIRHMCLRWAIG